jgi:GNAT superfamily N-acetyltransferase
MTTEPAPALTAEALADLRLATQNAAALWSALGRSRGDELIRRPGFQAVDAYARGAGLRVVMVDPNPGADELADLFELVRSRAGRAVVLEDPFSSVDFTELGLTARQLPVMIRRPGSVPAPPALEVTTVERLDQLETVEDIVVHAFPLPDFQPYRPGHALPKGLLDDPTVKLHLIARDGAPAGACITVTDGAVGGIYFVTTVPEHRSTGVARALMHAILRELKDLPLTLTAATAGKPLYDSLGFTSITRASWWA